MSERIADTLAAARHHMERQTTALSMAINAARSQDHHTLAEDLDRAASEAVKSATLLRRAAALARMGGTEMTGRELIEWAANATEAEIEAAVDPRAPDHSRTGVFVYHNCWRCKDGTQPERCPNPAQPRNCDTLHARND